MDERFEIFTTLIAKINRSIKKIKSMEMHEFDLKVAHTSCLYYLYKKDVLTAKELCDICDEDKAAISRSLDYLEKNGYIMCESNTKKRYRAPIELTEKGTEVGKKISNKIEKILDEVSSGISEEERKIMYKNLMIISKNLEKISIDKED